MARRSAGHPGETGTTLTLTDSHTALHIEGMPNKFEEIRGLLSELESEMESDRSNETMRVFSGLELPDIVRDITDFLMPILKPYEANFYWYLLRHSIIETGNPVLRVSTRGLQEGVIRSAKADSTSGGKEFASATLSLQTVRDTLRGLEDLGAIRKEGDATRDGTLYRILLPEEIPACQAARIERQTKAAPAEAKESEADYYNIRENRSKVYERDEYKCQHCGKQLTRFTATLDHIQAIANGGDNSLANLVTACRECNSRKHARLLGDFLADESPTR
jgi:hypothetical protein